MPDILDEKELRVPARNEQQHIGRLQILGQPRSERMCLEMVHGNQGQVMHERDGLGLGQPDEYATDQPRPTRRRDGRKLAETDTRLTQRIGDDLIEAFDMRPRRDLRDDAAIGAMLLPLRAHDAGKDPPLTVRRARNDGCGGFVAARLDSENELGPPLLSRRIVVHACLLMEAFASRPAGRHRLPARRLSCALR